MKLSIQLSNIFSFVALAIDIEDERCLSNKAHHEHLPNYKQTKVIVTVFSSSFIRGGVQQQGSHDKGNVATNYRIA